MTIKSLLSVTLLLMLGACASTGAMPTKTQSGMLANPAGMTLYVFDKDAAGSGKSVCNGSAGGARHPLRPGLPAGSAT
jgi:predicted lipoprotein with Yx(FWY)xxD motif